jgi:hypothetical protein
MRFILIVLLFINFSIIEASAQIVRSYDSQVNFYSAIGTDRTNVIREFDSRYKGVKGTPFFKPSWNLAKITFISGAEIENVPVKINVIDNELMVKRSTGDSVILESKVVSKVLLYDNQTGEEYLFYKGSDFPDFSQAFYLILYEGKSGFFARHKKDRLEADYQGGYNAGRRSDELIDMVDYYIRKKDMSYNKVKLNKKSILSAIGDDAVKDYLKKNKINLNSTQEVVEVLKYIDSL